MAKINRSKNLTEDEQKQAQASLMKKAKSIEEAGK